MKLIEPYDARPIECIEVWPDHGWRVKAYGITYREAAPRIALVDTARILAGSVFPQPAVTKNRYGCGFAGIHQGRGANFLFYCWWENENELLHRVFVSGGDTPGSFAEQSEKEVRACVWDVAVIAHERDAWVRNVLDNASGPNLEAYIEDRLKAMV